MEFVRVMAAMVFTLATAVVSAAPTDIRLLLDSDDDPATGCTVASMHGVDHVLVVRVETTATAGTVTRTHRQACVSGSLGSHVELGSGWDAGYDPASGAMLVEASMPFAAFGGSLPATMRIGVEAQQGSLMHRAFALANGDAAMFPRTRRRRAASAPGALRAIALDGDGSDWNGLDPLFDGIASSGTPGLCMLKVFAFADTNTATLFFRVDADVSTDAPFANGDEYQRAPGLDLHVPAPGILANDGDPNGLPLTATPISAAAHGTVTLNPDGSFTYTPNDPAAHQNDAFQYKASNGTKESNAAQVRIAVRPNGAERAVAVDDVYTTGEDESVDVASPGVLGNDIGTNALTAALLAPPAHGTVVLDANGGFTYTPAADYFGADEFTYTASDGTNSDTATVTITVTPVNDPPVVTAVTLQVMENVPPGTALGTVSASDVDAGQTLTWAITAGNGANRFEIDPMNGLLAVRGTIDFEATSLYTLTVQASDDATPPASGTTTVTIHVRDANEPPAFTSPTTATVAENSVAIATLSAADAEGQPLTFGIAGGADRALFAIDPSTGALSFVSPRDFEAPADAGGDNTYVVDLTVTDGTNTVTQTFTATIANENEAPSFTSAAGVFRAEGGAGVMTVQAVDPEGAPVTYVIAGGADAARFTLDAFTGTLVFNAAPNFEAPLDADANNVYLVNISATDGVLTAAQSIAVTVTDANDAPLVTSATAFAAPENTTAVDTVTATDEDGNAVVYSITGGADGALFSIDATTGALGFVAPRDAEHPTDNGANNVYEVRVTASDGTANTASDIAVTVTNVNDAPLATDASLSVSEDASVAVPLTASDDDGDTLTWTVDAPQHGALSGVAPALTYTPHPNYAGADAITFRVSDGTANSNVGTITITVHAQNDAPLFTSTPVTVSVEDSVYGYAVAASDVDGDTLSFSARALPAWLTLIDHLDGTATLSGTPRNGDVGAHDLVVVLSDGTTTAEQSFTITVANTNDAPVAIADGGYTVDEGGSLTGAATVLGNDQDDDGDALTAALVTAPEHAASFTFRSDGTFDYAHDGSETVSDSFLYRVSDGDAQSAPVTVSLTVTSINDVPVATADAYIVDEEGTLNVPAATGVLSNDTDPDTTPTAVLVTTPAHAASFTLSGDGSFAYTHDGSETVSDSFTYKANDGAADSSIVSVSVTVNALNDAPVNAAPATLTVVEDTATVLSFSVADAEATALRVTLDASNGTLSLAGVSGLAFTDGDGSADATMTFDGTIADINNALASVTFAPATNYAGAAAVRIRTSDLGASGAGGAREDDDTVAVTIDAVNDVPVATVDAYTVAEGATRNELAGTGVLANDSDPDDSLTAVLVAGPGHAASFTLHADGSFDYTHDGSETASDSFTYKANDGTTDSNVVTVSITIQSVNDTPVAVADSGYSVDEGATLAGAASVLANDSDGEGDSLTAILVAGPSHAASFTLHSDGTFDYTHDGSETTADAFTYKARDGVNDSLTVAVSIAVNALNDAPSAVADAGHAVNEGGVLTNATTVLANDSDGEGSPLTASLVSGPANSSSFTLHANGTFDYTHNGGETTSDSFSYKANDGTLDSNTVTVTITIHPVNDVPSFVKGPDIDADSATGTHTSDPWATAISAGTGETQSVHFVIDSNDNAALFATAPAVSATGVLTFTPVPSATGIANITLHIQDDGGVANGGVNASAQQSFVISLDSSPSVVSTSPAQSNVVPTNKQVSVTFNEPVTVSGTWFSIVCSTSGTHNPANSTIGGSGAARTIDTAGFNGGETCTLTIFGAQVSDDDGIDPPNVMAADVTVNFTVDAAPAVTSTTPSAGAANRKTDTPITITFSEAVTAGVSDFSIECPAASAQPFTVSGSGTNTVTLDPVSDLPAGTTCTVKVLTTVVDADAFDPPDALAAMHTFTFTTDAQPAVTTTAPADAATDVAKTANITIQFSENVDTAASSFTIKCPASAAAIPFTFVGASANTGSVTLDPDTSLVAGELCTVTVIASLVNDTDADDPPANLAANYVFSFGVEPDAVDDTHPHTHVGNIRSDSHGVFAATGNDISATAFTVTAYDATTVNGGTIVMQTSGANMGEFTYNPPAGFEGTDTFTYTIANAHGSDTATVSIVVSGMVWFIDSNAPAAGDGRLGTPFNSLAAFEARNGVADSGNDRKPQAGDAIFLYESATAYSGPVTLENNQKLIGQDSATAIFGAGSVTGLTPAGSQMAVPAGNSANGVFVSVVSAGNGVVLAQNNQVRGLRFGSNGAMAISGTGFGSLVVRDVLVNNAGGGGFSLTNGTIDAQLASFATSGGTHALMLSGVGGSFNAPGAATIGGATTAAISITGGAALTIGHGGTISMANGRSALLASNIAGGSTIALNTVNVSGTGAGNDAITIDGTGGEVDVTIASATINTNNMDDGLVISDLGANSSVTISGSSSITSNGAGRRVIEFGGTTNCACNFSAVTLDANTSDGLSLGSGQLGTYTFGDLDVNAPAGGVGVQVVGDANAANADSSITFRSIDINTCSDSGILLHSHSGSFAVTGTGTANSGGTIQGCTKRGAKFGLSTSASTGAKNISLTDMRFMNNATADVDPAATCGDAANITNSNCAANVDLQFADTVSLTRILASGSQQIGINGRDVTNLTLATVEVTGNGNSPHEDGIQLTNLKGTSTWTGLNVHDNTGRQLEVQNSSGTNNITISSPTFTNLSFPPAGNHQQAVLFAGSGSANMKLTMNNVTIARNRGAALHTDVQGGASADVTINGGTLIDNGQHLSIGMGGTSATGTLKYALMNVTQAVVDPAHTNGGPIAILKGGNTTGSMEGVISGNVFGTPGVAFSGSPCISCVIIDASNGSADGGLHKVSITGNQFRESGHQAINIAGGGDGGANPDSSQIQANITGNTISNPSDPISGTNPLGDQAIVVNIGTGTGDTTQACVHISGNTISGSWAGAAGGGFIRVRNRQTGTGLRLPGFTGPFNDSTAAASFVSGRNGNVAASAQLTNSAVFTGGTPATCF